MHRRLVSPTRRFARMARAGALTIAIAGAACQKDDPVADRATERQRPDDPEAARTPPADAPAATPVASPPPVDPAKVAEQLVSLTPAVMAKLVEAYPAAGITDIQLQQTSGAVRARVTANQPAVLAGKRGANLPTVKRAIKEVVEAEVILQVIEAPSAKKKAP